MLLVLVDRESRADRRDLEQDAARLAEVHRAEVEAFDHRRWPRTSVRDPLAPALLVLWRRRKRHVVHGSRALSRIPLRSGSVVRVEAPPPIAAHLPAPVLLAAGEVERPAEQARAAGWICAVGAHPVEALQRVLARDPRRARAQRLIGARGRHQLVLETLGIAKDQAVLSQLRARPVRAQPLPPEVQSLVR